jgi:ribA/ribD-fused uncharacterized protein
MEEPSESAGEENAKDGRNKRDRGVSSGGDSPHPSNARKTKKQKRIAKEAKKARKAEEYQGFKRSLGDQFSFDEDDAQEVRRPKKRKRSDQPHKFDQEDKEATISALKKKAEDERPKGNRRVTFDVHHANVGDKEKESKGYIFFFSCVRRYGGPFAFLSNFAPTPFVHKASHKDHTFVSMEQFYQYNKAQSFRLVREIAIRLADDTVVSSWEISPTILQTESAFKAATYVRTLLDAAMKQDAGWYAAWEKLWLPIVKHLLQMGLKAKFADKKLMDLLQKTGDYELVEASPNDKKFGIGFAAHVAFQKRKKWEDNENCNLLGQALMKLRDSPVVASGDDAVPLVFDRGYWDDKELSFWEWVCENQAAIRAKKF